MSQHNHILTDKRIVELCIPPNLIRYLIECQLDGTEHDEESSEVYAALMEASGEYLSKLDHKSRIVIARRMKRLMMSIYKWFKKNNFDSRKALIMSLDWVIALNDAGYITIDNEGFIHAIEKLHRIFDEGNSNVENWDKIERSAIKSGSKFHEFVQKQGYYTVN